MELDLLPIPAGPTCSSQNPPSVLDRDWTNISGGSHGNEAPFEDQPATPSAYPCVVFDGWGGGNGYNFTLTPQLSSVGCGTCSSPVGSSAYTELYSWVSTFVGGIGGYVALTSGAPPLFAYAIAASDDGGSFLSFSLQTAATAPVQTADGDGSSITFDDPPTPGNMIVMYYLQSTNGSAPSVNPGTLGWTLASMADGPGGTGVAWGGIASGALSIWTRCVQDGDTATYDYGAVGFASFASASEWEIT